jgi:hypothetical protein
MGVMRDCKAYSFTVEDSDFYVHSKKSHGICLACQQWSLDPVAEDAEELVCGSCGEPEVMSSRRALEDQEIIIVKDPL